MYIMFPAPSGNDRNALMAGNCRHLLSEWCLSNHALFGEVITDHTAHDLTIWITHHSREGHLTD